MNIVNLEASEDWHIYTKKYNGSSFTGMVRVINEGDDFRTGGEFITYKLVNGMLHCEDGPAIEWESGNQYWYNNDVQHREDGPAVIYADGSKFWYLDGIKMESAEQHFNNLTLKQKEKAIWNINEWR